MKKNEIPVAQNNDFDGLVAHIQQTQDVLQNNARLVINRHYGGHFFYDSTKHIFYFYFVS